MSSASPGHVITGASPEDTTHTTAKDALVVGHRLTTPQRATTHKRARDSPSTPSRTRAMALLGSFTDSVRTNAVRGLRAITDTIERGRDNSSTSSDSQPPSPTATRGALFNTPDGKRRRTVLTENEARRTHANWRGTQWDYSRAMDDGVFYHVAESGPSGFPLPRASTTSVEQDAGMEQDGAMDAASPVRTARPPSVTSVASAPAALSTPQAPRTERARGPAPSPEGEERGWVMSYDERDMPAHADTAMDDSSDDGVYSSQRDGLASVIRKAATLLTRDALSTPDACGAVHEFQVRLRALDPQGNFAPQCPAGELAACEIRELRATVDTLKVALLENTTLVRQLLEQRTQDAGATTAPHTPDEVSTPQTTPPAATTAPETVQEAAGAGVGATPKQKRTQAPAKEVGRHDERRAVFCPTVPFGGRISSSTPQAVRKLNDVSYQLRDAVNGALRDHEVSDMRDPEDAVQVAGVNWTERGNLCAVVCDGFTATQLIAKAGVVVSAANLGEGCSAHRDVPIFKAVLCNVPTKRADGSLFTEADVLADLRAHSYAFESLKLADSAEPARWISSTDVRTLKPRSTLLLNFSTEQDASRFLAMRRRLFAFGCMCEPGTFQPRDRDRICTRCWNPQARHRERDYACRERCRLCGGKHIEEDHTCTQCDALAKPCEHIKLQCVNCGKEHAADAETCEHRRRVRGTATTAPPMSQRATPPERTQAPKGARKKGRTVRILEPHEPFPDETPATSEPAPDSRAQPARLPDAPKDVPLVSTSTAKGKSPPAAQGEKRQGRGSTARDEGKAEEATPDDADCAALSDLLGAEKVLESVRSSASEGPSSARRATSSRIAASEAAKEDRRRKAAHILVRNFKFLNHPEAIAALKVRGDDYVSTVSWAAEERAKRTKSGMQGKSESSLQKLVQEMTALSAPAQPTPHNDTASTRTNA